MRAIRLLALRRLRLQPLRALVAAVVIGAGVSLTVSVVVVMTSLQASVEDAGRALAGPTPLRVIGATSRGGIDDSTVAKVQQTDGVAAAIPMVQSITLAERADGHEVAILAFGFDCRVEVLFGPFGCSDAGLAAATTPFVAPKLAAELGKDAVLRTDVGRTPLDGAVPVGALDGINEGRVVAMPLATAQQLFVRPHAVDVIYVQPEPGVDLVALRHRLEAAVGPNHGVLTPKDPPPVVGVVLAAFLPLFTIIAVLTLAIGAVLVRNSVALSIEERRRQTAIVSALGGSSRTLVGGTLIEAALLGLVGGAFGALGGVAVAHPIAASLTDFTEKSAGVPLRVHVEPVAVIVALLVGLVVALGAAFTPARRAARLDVAAELSNRDRRDEATGATSNVRVVLMLAVLVVGLDLCWIAQRRGALEPWQATLAPLAFVLTCATSSLLTAALAPRVVRLAERLASGRSAAARLAVGNLLREPKRTGVMAVALGFAVGIGFITASFNSSVRTAISDNLTVHLTGVTVSSLDPNNTVNIDAKMSPDTIARLGALPGVARVDKGAAVVVGHEPGKLIGVRAFTDPWLSAEVLAGSDDRGLFDAGHVLIGPGLARTEGLRPGDDLSLDTPTGAVVVPIMGVVQDGDFGGRNVLMTMGLLEQLYGPQPTGQVIVQPQPGITAEQLVSTIRAAKLDPDLVVQTRPEVVSRVSRDIGKQLASFDALQRGLLVMSFVAVLSTLLLVGIQRQRELGMLAAVGMTPRELARMVVYEAGLVAVAGAIVGLGVSLANYGALLLITPVIIGFKDPFVVDPAAAAVYASIAIVVALLAACWPAWRASRVEVLRALQYE
jgi:putative ABC transport system permease protein